MRKTNRQRKIRIKHSKKNKRKTKHVKKTRKYTKRKYSKRKNTKRKNTRKMLKKKKRGGTKQCVSGGPTMISILEKDNKKIILFGEHHLDKERGNKEELKQIIQKSIDKKCFHFSSLIEKLIRSNNDKNYDLFLEISPIHYEGDIESLGSGGMIYMTKLKNKNIPNLRIHWADLRSAIHEEESASMDLSEQELYELYNISNKNIYWKMIKMYKIGGMSFQYLDLQVALLERDLKDEKKTEQQRNKQLTKVTNYYNRLIEKNKLDLNLIKDFTRKIKNNDQNLKNDFGNIMLKLFYKPTVTKIEKQWQNENDTFVLPENNDPYNIENIFLDSTWENYVRKSLIGDFGDLIEKILNDNLQPQDFRELYKYMQLINTIIFAVILDFYIIGRIMKSYINDNIIIYTGAAHTRNYKDILKKRFGYSEIYSAGSLEGENNILDFDDTELFMYF